MRIGRLVRVFCLPLLALACTPEPGAGDEFVTFTGADDVTDTSSSSSTSETGESGTSEVGESCGNGVVEGDEECDLGDDNDDAGQCTSACQLAACGDGFVLAGLEECDDGNTTNTDACVQGCKLASCGDGFVQDGIEACDDGNDIETDSCTMTCMPANCGDGIVQVGEQCDDGDLDTADECPACQLAFCGDGFIQAGIEVCDDGNLANDDGCIAPLCVPAECGDGEVYAGMEECDEAESTPTCDADCTSAACGDGFANATAGEECDDGNNVSDDGCSATCESESTCVNNPQWTPVNCSTGQWVWSSDRANAPTLVQANAMHVLWTGCSHGGVANTCSLDGQGWVSTQVTAMAGCDATWYHLGGAYTGNCGGHDGDQVRRLALGPNDCYAY